MSKINTDELVAYLAEPGNNQTTAAEHFSVNKATIRTALRRPGEHLEEHPPFRLKERDLRVLDIIKEFIVENGWAPTTREVAAVIGGGPNPVHHIFHKLAAHGLIEISGNPRALRVVGSTIIMPGAPQ